MTKGDMFSTVMSASLTAIEEALLGLDVRIEFSDDAFRAALLIFQRAVLDKMWELQESENMSQEDRGNMAENCGLELRNIVKRYTGIKTTELY